MNFAIKSGVIMIQKRLIFCQFVDRATKEWKYLFTYLSYIFFSIQKVAAGYFSKN